MRIMIQCSNCGEVRLLKKSMKDIDEAVKDGWCNFGSALYCPTCSKTWNQRNPEKELQRGVYTRLKIAEQIIKGE